MASSSSIPTASWHALSAATMARNNCMFPCLLSVILNAVGVSCCCLYILPRIPGPRGYLPCKKEGDKKRGVESTTSIFQVELFGKMDSRKKRAYSHVFLVRTDKVQPKHNGCIISCFIDRYGSVIVRRHRLLRIYGTCADILFLLTYHSSTISCQMFKSLFSKFMLF